MKYLSLDIETTGLDPNHCNILELGAYVEDTAVYRDREELPFFHAYLDLPVYTGEPYALAMNVRIFETILKLRKSGSPMLMRPTVLVDTFSEFLYKNFGDEIPVPAGKNVAGFDIPFLATLPRWNDKIALKYRTMDPSMLFFNPLMDVSPPSLAECKKRAKLPEHVSHEALDDAWDVIQLFRTRFPHYE
jgi:oligoribonuclease